MSDHLPECPSVDPLPATAWCICDRLRACEARERDKYQRILIKHGAEMFVRGEQIGREMAYAAGVQAARDAVAALPHDTYCVTRDENYNRPCNCLRADAIDAIDSLKEN